VRHKGEHALTADELQMVFAEATRSGVIEEDERAIMTGIMRLATRPVRELMTPRTELDTIDRKANEEEIRAAIKASPHSLLPVADGSPDNIVGVIKVKDVQAVLLAGKRLQLGRLIRKAEIVPDQLDAMEALRMLQQSGVSMALVHDEYGHLEGVVTPADLLSAIVGNFASHQDEGDAPLLTVREDGSLLVAGALPADAMADRLGIELPDDRDYATAAGYVLSVLKRLPGEGEHFTEQDWRFEVVDMDGRKIDKLLVSAVAGVAEK
jgi:putative hemolysin